MKKTQPQQQQPPQQPQQQPQPQTRSRAKLSQLRQQPQQPQPFTQSQDETLPPIEKIIDTAKDAKEQIFSTLGLDKMSPQQRAGVLSQLFVTFSNNITPLVNQKIDQMVNSDTTPLPKPTTPETRESTSSSQKQRHPLRADETITIENLLGHTKRRLTDHVDTPEKKRKICEQFSMQDNISTEKGKQARNSYLNSMWWFAERKKIFANPNLVKVASGEKFEEAWNADKMEEFITFCSNDMLSDEEIQTIQNGKKRNNKNDTTTTLECGIVLCFHVGELMDHINKHRVQVATAQQSSNTLDFLKPRFSGGSGDDDFFGETQPQPQPPSGSNIDIRVPNPAIVALKDQMKLEHNQYMLNHFIIPEYLDQSCIDAIEMHYELLQKVNIDAICASYSKDDQYFAKHFFLPAFISTATKELSTNQNFTQEFSSVMSSGAEAVVASSSQSQSQSQPQSECEFDEFGRKLSFPKKVACKAKKTFKSFMSSPFISFLTNAAKKTFSFVGWGFKRIFNLLVNDFTFMVFIMPIIKYMVSFACLFFKYAALQKSGKKIIEQVAEEAKKLIIAQFKETFGKFIHPLIFVINCVSCFMEEIYETLTTGKVTNANPVAMLSQVVNCSMIKTFGKDSAISNMFSFVTSGFVSFTQILYAFLKGLIKDIMTNFTSTFCSGILSNAISWLFTALKGDYETSFGDDARIWICRLIDNHYFKSFIATISDAIQEDSIGFEHFIQHFQYASVINTFTIGTLTAVLVLVSSVMLLVKGGISYGPLAFRSAMSMLRPMQPGVGQKVFDAGNFVAQGMMHEGDGKHWQKIGGDVINFGSNATQLMTTGNPLAGVSALSSVSNMSSGLKDFAADKSARISNNFDELVNQTFQNARAFEKIFSSNFVDPKYKESFAVAREIGGMGHFFDFHDTHTIQSGVKLLATPQNAANPCSSEVVTTVAALIEQFVSAMSRSAKSAPVSEKLSLQQRNAMTNISVTKDMGYSDFLEMVYFYGRQFQDRLAKNSFLVFLLGLRYIDSENAKLVPEMAHFFTANPRWLLPYHSKCGDPESAVLLHSQALTIESANKDFPYSINDSDMEKIEPLRIERIQKSIPAYQFPPDRRQIPKLFDEYKTIFFDNLAKFMQQQQQKLSPQQKQDPKFINMLNNAIIVHLYRIAFEAFLIDKGQSLTLPIDIIRSTKNLIYQTRKIAKITSIHYYATWLKDLLANQQKRGNWELYNSLSSFFTNTENPDNQKFDSFTHNKMLLDQGFRIYKVVQLVINFFTHWKVYNTNDFKDPITGLDNDFAKKWKAQYGNHNFGIILANSLLDVAETLIAGRFYYLLFFVRYFGCLIISAILYYFGYAIDAGCCSSSSMSALTHKLDNRIETQSKDIVNIRRNAAREEANRIKKEEAAKRGFFAGLVNISVKANEKNEKNEQNEQDYDQAFTLMQNEQDYDQAFTLMQNDPESLMKYQKYEEEEFLKRMEKRELEAMKRRASLLNPFFNSRI